MVLGVAKGTNPEKVLASVISALAAAPCKSKDLTIWDSRGMRPGTARNPNEQFAGQAHQGGAAPRSRKLKTARGRKRISWLSLFKNLSGRACAIGPMVLPSFRFLGHTGSVLPQDRQDQILDVSGRRK